MWYPLGKFGTLTLAVDIGGLAGAGEGEAMGAGCVSEVTRMPFGLVWFAVLTSWSVGLAGATWASGNPPSDALEGGVA